MDVTEKYLRRLAIFGEQRNAAEKSEIVYQLLIHAFLNTHLCFETYVAFLDTIKPIIKEAYRRKDQEDEHFKTLMQRVDAAHDQILDADFRTRNVTVVRDLKQLDRLRHVLGSVHVTVLYEIINTLFVTISHSLERIYESSERSLASDALEVFFDNLLGLTPVGPFKSLVDGVRKIHHHTRITQIYDAAADLMGFLENYVQTTQVWALVTQHTIDSLHAFAEGNGDKVSLEKSADSVKKRLSEIAQRLQDKIVGQ
jgi:hypothetical protein